MRLQNHNLSAWMSLTSFPSLSTTIFNQLGSINMLFTFFFSQSISTTFILIRSHKMQQYAGIYLLKNYSTCFGGLSHPSSGVHKTVTAACGTGHSIWATTFLRRGLIRLLRRKVVAKILWPIPKAGVTVLCSPDDGCDGHAKHVENDFAVNKYLHTLFF